MPSDKFEQENNQDWFQKHPWFLRLTIENQNSVQQLPK